MSSVLKAQGQTAYERWEMSSFAQGHGQDQLPTRPQSLKKREQAMMPEIQQQLAVLAENARQEGYAAGLQQGQADGMQQALAAMQSDKQALAALTAALNQAAQKSEQQIAEHLLQLAMDLACAMLKSTLAADTAAILPIVREAVQALPYVQQPARIRLHPQDAAAVRHYLTEETAEPWRIVEDAHVERGGCFIETGANQVDASNATRWKRIADALGQKNEWNAA